MKKTIFVLFLFSSCLVSNSAFSQANTYFHDRIDTTLFGVADTVGHGANNYFITNTTPDFNVKQYVNGLTVNAFIKKGNTGPGTLTLITRTGTLSTKSIRKAPGAILASGDLKDSCEALFTYYNGHWRLGDMVPASSSSWMLTGNAGTTAGTNFLGTTDAVDFVVKTNNTEKARMSSAGVFSLGLASTNNGSLLFRNSTNANTLTINSGVTSSSHSWTLPLAQGAAGTFLSNNGSGTLSWGGITVGSTPITSGTSGAIPFNNAGVYGEDATQLFWDNTNNRLGIGTASPLAILHAVSTGTVQIPFLIDVPKVSPSPTPAALTTQTNNAFRVNEYGMTMIGGVNVNDCMLEIKGKYLSTNLQQYLLAVKDSALNGVFHLRGDGATTFNWHNVTGNTGLPAEAQNVNINAINYSSTALYNNNANLNVFTTDAQSTGVGGTIALGGKYGSGSSQFYGFGMIRGAKENSINADGDGYLQFSVVKQGVGTVDVMRMSSGGLVGIGITAPTSTLHVVNTNSTQPTFKGVGSNTVTIDYNGVGDIVYPRAAYTSTVTQTYTSATEAKAILFNVQEDTLGIYDVGDSLFYCRYAGVYEFEVHGPVNMTAGSGGTYSVWWNKNGTIINPSGNKTVVNSTITLNIVDMQTITMAAGDYVKVSSHADDIRIQLLYTAAGVTPTRPAIPSAHLIIKKISKS